MMISELHTRINTTMEARITARMTRFCCQRENIHNRMMMYMTWEEFMTQRLFFFCNAITVMMMVSESDITRNQKNNFTGSSSLRKDRTPKRSGISGLYWRM